MRIIGLTGGIASGKSTAAGILRDLGAPVVDADQLARQVVEPEKPAWQRIVRRFGQTILLSDGTLDRKALGAIVFSDPDARRDLNAITHPKIRQAYREAMDELKNAGQPLAIYDVPLLFEARLEQTVDEIWVVYVPRTLQRQRLMARDGLTEAEADMRLSAQMPLDEKARRADQVIENTGSLSELREKVRQRWLIAKREICQRNNNQGNMNLHREE